MVVQRFLKFPEFHVGSVTRPDRKERKTSFWSTIKIFVTQVMSNAVMDNVVSSILVLSACFWTAGGNFSDFSEYTHAGEPMMRNMRTLHRKLSGLLTFKIDDKSTETWQGFTSRLLAVY